MLVAGAGYGKTTLAEQWAAHGHRVAWIRARRSSADVAVLARQMAAAGASVVPGADRRLTERLNATKDPAEELSILVDLLSEDLAAWPDDAWLAIDDYQYVKESATAEAFVEGVIDQSPVQVLIATRERPSWVSMRSVLYGEVLEIGQAMLAMSEEEVQDLLAGANEELSTGLLALAGGWPAVVGLASLTSGDVPLPVGGSIFPISFTSTSPRRYIAACSPRAGSRSLFSRQRRRSIATLQQSCWDPSARSDSARKLSVWEY
jgi:ATP/maltotriose-dependent transcriptional regulator MalT